MNSYAWNGSLPYSDLLLYLAQFPCTMYVVETTAAACGEGKVDDESRHAPQSQQNLHLGREIIA